MCLHVNILKYKKKQQIYPLTWYIFNSKYKIMLIYFNMTLNKV